MKLSAQTTVRAGAGGTRTTAGRHVGNMFLRKTSARFSSFQTIVRAEPREFDEGAAQVRRLLDRDRKDVDFDELESAFDSPQTSEGSPVAAEATAAAPAPSAPPAAPAPSASPASPSISMGSKATISPFGPTAGSPLPFEPTARKPSIEPRDLSPDMKPDRIEDSTPWWTKITLTQVVIVLSFTTIIGLMIATFFVVLNMGAIRLNE